jgi:acyltransferase
MRLCWVDNAKAIGIILVVYGHTIQCGTLAKELIYSFHMPLFFFLAGYLVKDSHLRVPLLSFLKNNLRRLIVPYFTFWFLSYLLWLPTRALRTEAFHSSLSLIDPVVGLFYGIEENLYVNPALWFFPCLFIARLVFWGLQNRLNPKALIVAITVAPILGIALHGILPFRLPWGIDSALVALFFYGQGYSVARAGILEKRRPLRNWAGITMLCFVPLVLIANSNGNVAMDQMAFGNSVLFFFMTAVIGIVMAVSVAKLIPHTAMGRWLSENTIIIFPYHKLAFNVFAGIGVVFCGLEIGFRESLLFCFLFTSGALALSFPVVYIIRRYMPWVAGLSSVPVRLFVPSISATLQLKGYSVSAVEPQNTRPL